MLSPGTRFGPYEIIGSVAEGGMGEVYKARDTRLDRTVALKVLPEHLSTDPELRRRFEREARAISALSHPNICTLFDIGHQEGREFLVMEYLDGETLADRLSHGPLSLEEVVRYGVDIADALEKAHRQGIVHRDLKPGNIVLTRTGAKLLDFGLAKWIPEEKKTLLGRADDVTAQLTTQGTLLGTIPYMAPEQLEGKEIDPRTDIFAFGAILYEMATGVRAFNAASNASLIAAIMREEPVPPSRLRSLAPRALDHIIRTCLQKNPDDRFQSAHDVKIALGMLGGGAGEPIAIDETRRRPWLLPVIVGAIVVAAMLIAALALRVRQTPAPRVVRFAVTPPPGSTFQSLGEGGGLALSPDGRQLVFEATTPEGRTYLWLRALDSDVPEMLEGTEGGEYPFWSPDGRSIAFFADGKLKRMSLPDGPSQTICEAPTGRGGAWGSRGVIVFAPSSSGGLFRVNAAGGQPEPLTRPDPAVYSHRWPAFIDEERFVFVSQSQNAMTRGVFAASLDAKATKRLLPMPLSVAFAAPHDLYYVRDHVLVRQRLEGDALVGDPVTIANEIVFYADRAYVPITAASDGTVAFRRNGAARMRIGWFARDGRRHGTIGELGEYEGVSISPDGTRVAFGYFDATESLNHIAIAAARGGVPRRFTFTRGNQYSPIWSPDGAQLGFSDDQAGVDTITAKPVAGTGNERALIPPPPSSTYAQSWSPDGAHMLFRVQTTRTGYDIHVLDLGSGKAEPYVSGPSDESQGQFSPDGNWVAYTSTESGRPEVYVQPFPATGAKWQVSTGGGEQPRWRADVRELFYLAPDRTLMSVPNRVPGAFDEHSPQPLFATNIPFGDINVSQAYDVSADGERFVIAAPDPLSPQSAITVVTAR